MAAYRTPTGARGPPGVTAAKVMELSWYARMDLRERNKRAPTYWQMRQAA